MIGVGLSVVLVLAAEFAPSPAVVSPNLLTYGEPIGAGACVKCHPAVTAQWQSSAHRLSSFNNPYYAASTRAFRAERGFEASTFCGDCHDPALVAQMAESIDEESRDAQAGIACMACHGIAEVDRRGNGLFRAELTGPKPGREHAKHVARPILKTPALCGTCHRVGLPETVTHERWYRGQDEWGDWRDSGYAGRGVRSLFPVAGEQTCTDCHMPRVAAGPKEKGAQKGQVRSHRFLGANTALAHLEDDADQLAATQAFLQDVVTLRLADGGPGLVDVVLHNRGAGHAFPGGTADSNQVWVEWQALDDVGETLTLNADHYLRTWAVDADGRLLQRRDVQHQRAVAFDTRLMPGQPKVARYRIPDGTTRVVARLRYQKFSPAYARFACASLADGPRKARCLSPPITELARAEVALVNGRAPKQADWAHRAEHAAALAQGLSTHVVQARDLLEGGPPLPTLRARIAQALGQTTKVAEIVDALGEDAPNNALWIQASALARAYRTAPALLVAERLLTRLPDDRKVLALVARLRGVSKDPAGALRAAEHLLTIDPECEAGLFQRLLARRELGKPTQAAEIEWARHRRATEIDLELRRAWRGRRSTVGDPTEPVPVY
ncbi:MAG: hypothetical protein ACI9U2_004273 [Bradymonadia bacterium]|jgi:hypothetical protein